MHVNVVTKSQLCVCVRVRGCVFHSLCSTHFVRVHEALQVVDVDDRGSGAGGLSPKSLVRFVQVRDDATELLAIAHLSVALHQIPESPETNTNTGKLLLCSTASVYAQAHRQVSLYSPLGRTLPCIFTLVHFDWCMIQ